MFVVCLFAHFVSMTMQNATTGNVTLKAQSVPKSHLNYNTMKHICQKNNAF